MTDYILKTDYSENLKDFVKDVVGAVEANSFEYYALWEINNIRENKKTWEENLYSMLLNIGSYKDSDVFVNIRTAVIDGNKILFYYPTSNIVNWNMVEKWIRSILVDGTRLTDATNIHSVLRKA